MPFELPFGVAVLNPVPVDYYSGPYTASNIQQAINIASASIPYGVRFQSMEVRLIIAGVSKKYWYRDNITDLVEFSSIGSGNSDVFYNLGGTVSATNSTSAIYRTGPLSIGTGTASNSRFVVSSSGGTNSLVVNEQGYVGIGTSSPSTKLHIYATQSGTFRLQDGTQGNNYILTSDSNGVATWTPLSSIGISGASGSIPKFTGTSSLGNSRFYEIGATPNIVGYYGSGSSYVSFLPGGNTWLTLNRTQSSMSFILGNPQSPTFQVGQIQSTNTIGLSVESAGYTSFNTGPTYLEKMRITSDGYVGIGTASPSTKLHIYATQSGAFRLVDGTEGNNYILKSDPNGVASWTPLSSIGISGSASYIPMFTGTSSLGNSILYIEPVEGRTLIINRGRNLLSPISYLSVQRSQSQVDITLGNGDVVDIEQISSIISDNSNGFRVDSKGPLLLSTGTSYSEKVRISTNGNVGIGTASPSTKLHIFATQSGAFRLVDGTQGPGYLLASDINGVATWTASTYAPDSNVVHKTGNENISGVKTFQNIGVLTNVVVQNYNTNTSSSALLVQIGNPGMGIKSENESSGIGIYSNSTSTGLNYVGANSGVTTFSVNKIGGVYASSSVSIGTSGASASLHIKGTSSVSGNSLLVENSSNTQLLKVLNNGQIILGDNNFAAVGPGAVQGVFIIGPGNSNYGLNTSNPNLLTFIVGSTDPTFVSGIQGASANHGNVRSGIYFTNNASDIVFRTGPTATLPERMRINVSGDVGIGTASPSTKLHIFATQSGAFRLEDGTQSYPGYVLTSDANGVGTWQGNPQVTITTATATALASWNNTTVMSNFSATCSVTIPDTGLPPNFSFRFIVISGNSGSGISFTYSSPVSILPNTLLTFAQYESGVIDRLGTGQNYYITY